MARVIEVTAEHFDLTADDILGQVRFRAVNYARRIAMFIARERLGHSYPEIGIAFRRDHTTVMVAVKRVQRELRGGDRRKVRSDVATVVSRVARQKLRRREAVDAWWAGLTPRQRKVLSDHDRAALLALLGVE